jgi:hypothetical protein
MLDYQLGSRGWDGEALWPEICPERIGFKAGMAAVKY